MYHCDNIEVWWNSFSWINTFIHSYMKTLSVVVADQSLLHIFLIRYITHSCFICNYITLPVFTHLYILFIFITHAFKSIQEWHLICLCFPWESWFTILWFSFANMYHNLIRQKWNIKYIQKQIPVIFSNPMMRSNFS